MLVTAALALMSCRVLLGVAAVEGKAVPKEISIVTYTITVQNGAREITAGKYLVLSVPDYTPGSDDRAFCDDAASAVSWVGNKASMSLTSALTASTNMTCHIAIKVTPGHAGAGEIAAFTVKAEFSASIGGASPGAVAVSDYIAGNVTLGPVTVNSGSVLLPDDNHPTPTVTAPSVLGKLYFTCLHQKSFYLMQCSARPTCR